MKSRLQEMQEKLEIPEQKDGLQKLSHIIQLILFLGMFTAVFLLFCRLWKAFLLRAIGLVIAYVISALVLYLVIRPLCTRAEQFIRSKRGH